MRPTFGETIQTCQRWSYMIYDSYGYCIYIYNCPQPQTSARNVVVDFTFQFRKHNNEAKGKRWFIYLCIKSD